VSNQVVVGAKDRLEIGRIAGGRFSLTGDPGFDLTDGFSCEVQIRAHAEPVPATARLVPIDEAERTEQHRADAAHEIVADIDLAQSEPLVGVAPGQSAVLYLGTRVLGQFTPFDLVALLLISNVVQNSMIGPDTSVIGGLLGAAIILALNRLVSNDGRLRRLFEGSPTLLVENGRILEENLRRERISADEMQSALREHGVSGIDEVAPAVLETDGTISVCQLGDPTVRRLRTIRSSRNR